MPLVLGVAVRKRQLRFTKAVDNQADPKLRLFLSLEEKPRDPRMCPPTCKIVGVKSMLSLFGQLDRSTASSLEVPMDS